MTKTQRLQDVAQRKRSRIQVWRGVLAILGTLSTGCGACVDQIIHPLAIEHAAFCAEYIGQNQLVEAEARCKLAIEYEPEYWVAWNLLGLVEHSRKNLERATDLFKRAIAYNDDFAEAHNNLGAIFMESRNYGAACDQFKQAIEIDPGYLNARVNLAVCSFQDGDREQARNHYLRCAEIDPSSCDCRLGLGVLDFTEEPPNFDGAKTNLQKLTEVCPTFAEGYYNLCWVYMQMGRCSDAVDTCIGAIAQKPDYIEARQNLTKAYECLALQDGAIKEYIDEIRANPNDAEPHFNLGTVYDGKGLYDRALNEYLNALKLNPKHVLAHFRAAKAFDKLLKANETVLMCKRFVDLLRDESYDEQKEWCVNRVQELQFGQ